jgi:hypothetical protein
MNKKLIASGTGGANKKAPDKRGDFIQIQKRTLGKMNYGGSAYKRGGKVVKKGK